MKFGESAPGNEAFESDPIHRVGQAGVFYYAVFLGTVVHFISLVIGATSVTNCPHEPNIPIFLVISGMLGFVKLATLIYLRLTKGREDCIKTLLAFQFFLGLVVLMFGSLSVYKGVPSFEPANSDYCNPLAYFGALALTSALHCFVVIAILAAVLRSLCGIALCCSSTSIANEI